MLTLTGTRVLSWWTAGVAQRRRRRPLLLKWLSFVNAKMATSSHMHTLQTHCHVTRHACLTRSRLRDKLNGKQPGRFPQRAGERERERERQRGRETLRNWTPRAGSVWTVWRISLMHSVGRIRDEQKEKVRKVVGLAGRGARIEQEQKINGPPSRGIEPRSPG